MNAQADDGYVLARTEAEYQRLRLQARLWEPFTARVLAAAGLGPGMRCLDAGSGPGEAMRLIGRTVGPTGHVTGIDIDARLGARALADLHATEGPHFAFTAADITAGDPVPDAPFDLVFSRLLLIHMTDPVATVRALAALVRPGGKLVLMDYDLTRLACRPEDPAMTRAFAIIADCFTASGKHPDSGLRLAPWLADAGLPVPTAGLADTIYAALAALGPMVRAVLASLTETAEALGVAAAGEIADLQGRIAALEASKRHFGLGPVMLGVWTTVG